jgi:hypothetical protein
MINVKQKIENIEYLIVQYSLFFFEIEHVFLVITKTNSLNYFF